MTLFNVKPAHSFKRGVQLIALTLSLGLAGSVFSAPPENPIKLTDLDGKESFLTDYKGKWVILNLWATWCPPCLVEIPDLVMFHDEHKDKNAIVIGVNYEDNDPAKVKAFAESQLINYPIVRFDGKTDGVSSPLGKLQGLPTTYMIAPDGTVVAARTGLVDQKMLEDFMQQYEEMKGSKEK